MIADNVATIAFAKEFAIAFSIAFSFTFAVLSSRESLNLRLSNLDFEVEHKACGRSDYEVPAELSF